MPPRKDATQPEQPEGAAAPGNVNTADLLHDLEATQDLILRQEEAMQEMRDRIAAMEAAQAGPSDDDPALDLTVPTPAPLPEGVKRYAARMTEQTLIKTAGRNMMIDGYRVFQEAVRVDFNAGVYETADPEIQAWLAQHPDYGTSFWEDETAVKRHSTVDVVEGMKATATSPQPRAPLVAPMQ